MSDIKINNVTNRNGDTGPIIAGVSTVSSSAFMVMPSGNTEIRGAASWVWSWYLLQCRDTPAIMNMLVTMLRVMMTFFSNLDCFLLISVG